MEEYVPGEICSYDAIVNSKGSPLFETGNITPISIMDCVNEMCIRDSAGSVSIGIAALDHESGDDTMESQTIVEAFICQIDKVGYRKMCIRDSICRGRAWYHRKHRQRYRSCRWCYQHHLHQTGRGC